MIKGAIFALALVAGLVALASAQQKDAKYFENLWKDVHEKMSHGAQGVAGGLAYNVFVDCSASDDKKFSEDLANESSAAHKCAVGKLADPDTIASALMLVSNPEGGLESEFLNTIRGANSEATIEKLVAGAKQYCQEYVAGIVPFFNEVEGTEFANSDEYANELVPREMCQLFLKNGVSKETLAALPKYAEDRINWLRS